MIYRCKICKNGFFDTFFPFHIDAIFETRPSALLKNRRKCIWCALPAARYRENEYGEPHFLFHDFTVIRTVLPFDENKNCTNLCSVFTAVLLNCTDWAITGRIARVQFNFTLERKVKTGALLRFSQTCELSSSKAAFTIAFFATVNHSYDHRQRTLKNTNTQNGSKSTNHKSQTMTFWTR